MHVLDIGSGVGGPARTLASEFGCRVTGLDINEEYCGDALSLPFQAGSFDAATLIHTIMNVPNKKQLFHEVSRVLRPAGRLALYEVCAGNVSPILYPVVWAGDQSISFPVEPERLRRMILSSGFEEISWSDVTLPAAEWYRAMVTSRLNVKSSPLGMHLVVGDRFPEMADNVMKNLEENRITVIQAVFHRIR